MASISLTADRGDLVEIVQLLGRVAPRTPVMDGRIYRPSSRRTAGCKLNAPRSPDWWLFFTKFLQQGRGIASVVPSSPWLARGVLQGIDFGQARSLVELGAGT